MIALWIFAVAGPIAAFVFAALWLLEREHRLSRECELAMVQDYADAQMLARDVVVIELARRDAPRSDLERARRAAVEAVQS